MLDLGDETLEVERRHQNLGLRRGEGAEEELSAVSRADALAHVVAQPLLGRGQGPGRGAGRLRLARGGELDAAGKAADREAADLGADDAVRSAEGDVEGRGAGAGVILGQARPAHDLRGQRAEDADRPIGDRHPELVGGIARDQFDGPAGRDVHEAGVQVIASSSPWGRTRWARPSTLAEVHRAQHLPARSEPEVMRLRRGQRAGAVGEDAARAARADLVEIECGRRDHRQQAKLCLGVQLEGLAVERRADLHSVAAVLAGQGDADRGLALVLDAERRQEGQVADLEGRVPSVGGQRLRGQLQIAGARQQRVARLCAVLVQHPVVAGAPAGDEDAVAVRVAGRAVEKGLPDGFGRFSTWVSRASMASAAMPTSAQMPQSMARTRVAPPWRALAKALRYSLAAT